jgi:hypothetical protein
MVRSKSRSTRRAIRASYSLGLREASDQNCRGRVVFTSLKETLINELSPRAS